MKKHVFKRITAMVLIFVMCVLLMPTNSLGVKAVSTDDVLVDETQVTTENGAEDVTSEEITSETEITSEDDEDVVSEDEISEDISETEEEFSENTDDVISEDIGNESASEEEDATADVLEEMSDEYLVENENMVMAGNTVGQWTLSYDDKTETYDSFGEVSARIDALDNAEGVYSITADAESGNYIVFDEAFPTKAAELYFKKANNKTYVYANRLEADYKITSSETFELLNGGDIKEMAAWGGLYIHSSVAGDTVKIETLSMSHFVCTSTRVEIETCYLDVDSMFYLDSSYADRAIGETVYSTEGTFDITTVVYAAPHGNISEYFRFVYDEEYETGHVGLTTSTVIADSNISQNMTGSKLGVVVKNKDKTYSIVLKENRTYQYLLSYDSKVEGYMSYYDLVDRIDELNNQSKVYTIKITDENYGSESIAYWPETAKKLIFVAPDRKKTSMAGGNGKELILKASLSEYPIETKGWENVRVDRNTNIKDIKCSDTDMMLTLGEGCVIDNLTINSSIILNPVGDVTIGTLAYQYKSSYSNLIMEFGYEEYQPSSEWVYSYGALNADNITVASGIKSIQISVDHNNNVIETPILESANFASTVWDSINVSIYNAKVGYTVNQSISENGSRILQWEEDATTKIKLQYGDVEEIYNSLDQVTERINSINDVTNDYTITMSVFHDSLREVKINDMPTVANSLTFVNETGNEQTFKIMDTDIPKLTYSLVFIDYNIELLKDSLYTTGDITIQGKMQDCSLDAWWEFRCNGIMNLDGVDNVIIDDLLGAETLKWKPFNETTAKTNSFKILDRGSRGKISVTHFELAEGYTMNLICEGSGMDNVYMTVSSYSEDCLRVNMICNYTDENGNVYDGVMKVEDGRKCTYERAIVTECYYVTDSAGNTFINSNSWIDVQNAFNKFGNKTETYTIQVMHGKTIGALPTKAGKIILLGEEGFPNGIIKVSSATLDAKVKLEIRNARLEYSTKAAPVNIKMTAKDLVLNNVINVGTITGNSGKLDIYGIVNVAKIDKVNELLVMSYAELSVSESMTNITSLKIEGKVFAAKIDKVKNLNITEGGSLTVSGNMTNITNLGYKSSIYVWGDISVTNICTGGNMMHFFNYDIDKKLTISGTISFYEGTSNPVFRLSPYQNGNKMSSFANETVLIDSYPKAALTDIQMEGFAATQTIYRSGGAVKVGTYKIVVFENYEGDWSTAYFRNGTLFVTINDAIEHINRKTEGDFVIRLDANIPSAGTIKTIQGTGKTITIGSYKGVSQTLNFTGTFIVDGGEVTVKDVALCNSATANASVTLKNGAVITLSDTSINALTAPAGTKVIIANDTEKEVDVTIGGTAKCQGDFVMEDGTVLNCKGALTTGNFTAGGDNCELRMLSGKAFTINGDVTISESSPLCINYVDKNGNLAAVKSGATMVTATNGKAGQFTTQNLMTGTTDVCWLLTKSGKVIKTSGTMAYVYVKDNRQTVNSEFAGFNEAKEYIATKAGDSEEYVIELVYSTSGADLSDLPSNLAAIIKSEEATEASVKLTTSMDVSLTADLELQGVNLTASSKTIHANEHALYVDGGAVTAAKAKELTVIAISNATVTFTAKDSTINYVELDVGGTLKCPQFSGFEATPQG